eukprot:TRINITY_DN6405_c0_g1_i1.p1 TRINITY_DN6405_c0_g1~~TRINITY_DN6405_c0_g1_i1.p1  ORF type:complete len:275 (-),score=31.90 TRINITY_DN6405_c0_g1_i1:13-810(-)
MKIPAVTIALLGDPEVGKTCFINRYIDGVFTYTERTTPSSDVRTKVIHWQHQPLRVRLRDTCGQEKFNSLTVSYYRGAQAFIVMYDVTNFATFRGVEKYMDAIRDYANSSLQGEERRCAVLLLGNKTDLALPIGTLSTTASVSSNTADNDTTTTTTAPIIHMSGDVHGEGDREVSRKPRAVNTEDIHQLYAGTDLLVFESSVKNGEGVNEAVDALLLKLLPPMSPVRGQGYPNNSILRYRSNGLDALDTVDIGRTSNGQSGCNSC